MKALPYGSLAVATMFALPAIAQDQMEAATVTIAENGQYGSYLVDGDERALYVFSADKPAGGGEVEFSCSGECLESWPLFTAGEDPETFLDAEMDAYESLVGTMEHQGETVVTYNGWPLYRFVRDADAEGPQGQGVEAFGGTWHLLTPEGERIGAKE